METDGMDATPESSTGEESVVTEQVEESTEGVEETSGEVEEETPPFHTHPQWIKRQKELEAWRSLGDRESITSRLQQAEAYEQQQLRQWQLQQAKDVLQAPPQYGPRYTAEETAVRNDLLRIFPEFGAIMQQVERLGQNVASQQQATVYRGQDLIGKFASDLGVTSQNGKAALEVAIAGIIAQNRNEHQGFRSGDVGAVERAIEIYKTEVLDPIKRTTTSTYSQAKHKTANLPASSTIAGRGTPARPARREVEDTPEARADAGWSIIQGGSKK